MTSNNPTNRSPGPDPGPTRSRCNAQPMRVGSGSSPEIRDGEIRQEKASNRIASLFPLPSREREGPTAKRWEGEGVGLSTLPCRHCRHPHPTRTSDLSPQGRGDLQHHKFLHTQSATCRRPVLPDCAGRPEARGNGGTGGPRHRRSARPIPSPPSHRHHHPAPDGWRRVQPAQRGRRA